MQKIKNYFYNHKNVLYISLLIFGCIMFLLANLGVYSLIDIDETRYVNMSKYMYLTKEYITPILNFEPFLEKPPLYFWMNVIVYKFLNYQSVFIGRLATGILASFSVLFTYFFARKISKNDLFGFLSAGVLLSSAWFLIFSHIAILDMSFMVFSMSAIYSAILALFVENDKNKKYCWYFGYLFMALSILAKGFIGIAIPAMVVFFTYLAFKKVKELFLPINIIPGLIILLVVALPWHILIYNANGKEWVDMYILKHHFSRLLNSQDLGRKQPFLFYVPIILIGFFPWAFNFLALIYNKLLKLVIKIKNKDFEQIKKFALDDVNKKITAFSLIYFLATFLFFSSASTKLPSYILVLFPALALLVSSLWICALEKDEMKKELKISNYLQFGLLALVAILALVFALVCKSILPVEIQYYIKGALCFSVPAVIIILALSLAGIFYIKKDEIKKVFFTNILIMFVVVNVVCFFGMPYYSSFAQDEIEDFASSVFEDKDSNLITYGFSAKYSILNLEKKIVYITDNREDNYSELMAILNSNKDKKYYIITRNKISAIFDNNKMFKKIKEGKVYSIYIVNKK